MSQKHFLSCCGRHGMRLSHEAKERGTNMDAIMQALKTLQVLQTPAGRKAARTPQAAPLAAGQAISYSALQQLVIFIKQRKGYLEALQELAREVHAASCTALGVFKAIVCTSETLTRQQNTKSPANVFCTTASCVNWSSCLTVYAH